MPRQEPPTGLAGGKVVKVDRVIYENMPTSMTGVAAIQAGEIDFFELPPIDLLDQLEGDKNIKVEVLNKTGNVGWMRLNFLHPPFNNVDARQAMLYLVNQEEFMKATFGNPKYYKKCGSNFACGTPMENDENTQWFKEAPNPAKAKELFQKAGYDGRPVVVLHATNIDYMNNAAQITAQRLREIGVNVELATSDWGGVVTRRAVKTPPDQGGWNIFITSAGGASVGNPIALAGHAATGEKGWFGWPPERAAREAARQMGRRRDAWRSRRRSRARSRRTPGTSCRMSGSGSGSRPSPTGRTSRASSRSRRSSRSGTSRRPERRSFEQTPANKNARREPGVFSGARPRYCTRRGPPSAGFSFSPRMPRRRATSE